MRFTRSTYRAAIRRSLKREALLWSEHVRCFNGPTPWCDAMRHTFKLEMRQLREGKY